MLLDRHPRAGWRERRCASVDFWLEVHDGLRRDAAALRAAGDDYHRQRVAVRELAVLATPRLRGLLAQLAAHHDAEEFHYFPAFRDAERRLAPGFDLLARDHQRLAQESAVALAALNDLIVAAEPRASPDAAAPRLAAERYVSASARILDRLARHLDDEEDLVVPLLLERRG